MRSAAYVSTRPRYGVLDVVGLLLRELLLAHVLQKPRSYLFTWPDRELSDAALEQFLALLARRRNGEPVAYLLGAQGKVKSQGENAANYQNAEYDRLFEQMKAMPDSPARQAITERMLARQLVWAADTDAARNEAFNIANGDVFRWSWLWPKLASWFGVEPAGFSGTIQPLEAAMAKDHAQWREIALRHDLIEPDLDRLASAWHTDLDLGRPLEVMTDMANSRRLGFCAYQATDASFFDLFERLRAERLMP